MQRIKTTAAAADLRLRTRTALLGLEDKDLATQAQLGVQRLIKDLQATWEIESVLRDILAGLDQCSAHARRLRYKLAAVLVQRHGYPSGLINLIIKRFTEQAGFEKHSSAVEELAGFMQEVARAALLLHVTDEDMYDQQDDLSALLIRPLLKNAAKSPAKHTASNCYVLVNAALMVFFEQAQSPSVAAVALDCLRHILGSISSGQSGVLVAEAFLPMRKSVEILGGDMKPGMVRALITECLKCIKHKSDWQLRKQAADTIAALAASSQVFRKTEDAWQLERSDGLAVLTAEKSAISAALTDVKYDKIVHVRQAAQKALAEMNGIPEPSSPLKAAYMRSSTLQPPDGDDVESGDDFATYKQPDSPSGSTAIATAAVSENRPNRVAGPVKVRAQQQSMHITADKPKPKPRKRVAGNMDFGVQVYAPEPPQAPSSTQKVKASPANSTATVQLVQPPESASGYEQPNASQSGNANQQSSGVTEPSALFQHAKMDGDKAVDANILLEQLRSFHDLVAAAARQSPEEDSQPKPHKSPYPHPINVPDTPIYSTGTAPAETPQSVRCTSIRASSLCPPSCGKQDADPCTPQRQTAHYNMPGAVPWEATPNAKAIVQAQGELMAQLQQLLNNPAALQMNGAALKELQSNLLQATATLQHSRALHNIQGVLGDTRRFDTPPASKLHEQADVESLQSNLPAHGQHKDGLKEASLGGSQFMDEQEGQAFEDVLVLSSQRMQSLLSGRLSSGKGLKASPMNLPNFTSPLDAHGTTLHYTADANEIDTSRVGLGVSRSTSDERLPAARVLRNFGHVSAGLPGPVQDRRSTWHEGGEARAELPMEDRQRRPSSAADEVMCAPAGLHATDAEAEPLAGITREVNRLLRSPGKPPSRRVTLEGAATSAQLSEQNAPVKQSSAVRPPSAGSRLSSKGRPGSAGHGNSRAAPLATGARGSPDMNVHCNPLFGAGGVSQVTAPISAEKAVPSSKGDSHAESAGRTLTQLVALSDPEEVAAPLAEPISSINQNGAAGADNVLHQPPLQNNSTESVRKAAQLKALRLQLQKDLEELQRWVET
ncbi:g1775 [Coccomyxa elongata]